MFRMARWKPKQWTWNIQRPPTRLRAWQPPDQERLDKVKRDLAFALDRATFRIGYTQKQLAARLGTSQARVSNALGGDLEKVTVNQLIRYLILIEPNFSIQVAI